MGQTITSPWLDYVKPFRICGNLYFVGGIGGSSHLLDTADGLVLIDSGYPQALYQVIYNVGLLGFDPKNIRHIIHSHGHYDHLGATKALVELTGAKTYLGAPDLPYADGTLDLTWARELGSEYHEAFTPDVLINDGDKLTVGGTTFEFVLTPGHTPGTLTIFFDVCEGGKTYTCAMHGGIGLNSMQKDFLEKYGLSLDCRQAFLDGLERVKDRHVDIHLGNHVWNNDTLGKAARLGQKENPFIDPTAWPLFIENVRLSMLEMLEKEK